MDVVRHTIEGLLGCGASDAAKELLSIARLGEQHRHAIVHCGGVPPLIQNIRYGDEVAMMHCAAVVELISVDTMAHEAMLKARAIDCFLEVLLSRTRASASAGAGAKLVSVALTSLSNMAYTDECEREIGAAGGISAIADTLAHAHGDALQQECLRALINLTFDASNRQLAGAPLAHTLLALIGAPVPDVPLLAACVLNNLISDDDIRVAFAAAGGVGALLALLRATQHDELRVKLTSIIVGLASHSEASIGAFVATGGIDVVLEVLATACDASREKLMAMLALLSEDDAHGEQLLRPAALQCIVEALAVSGTACAECASTILWNLSTRGDAVALFIEHGVLSAVIRTMGAHESAAARRDCAQVLYHVIRNDAALRIAARLDSVQCLLRLITDDIDESVTQRALSIMWTLTDCVDVRAVIVRAEGIPVLLRCIGCDCTHDLRVYAAAALWNISAVEALRAPVAAAGGIAALVAMARGADAMEQEKATGALANLGITDLILRSIIAANVAPLLIELAVHGSQVCRTNALNLLRSISGLNYSHQELLRPACFEALRVAILDGPGLSPEHGAVILSNIALSLEGRMKIMAASLVEPLVRLLTIGEDKARSHAATALLNLTKTNPEYRPPVIAAGGKQAMQDLLRSHSSSVREIAANAIRVLDSTESSEDPELRAALNRVLRSLVAPSIELA